MRATAPFRLRRMACQYESLVIDYFISHLIPFQIWGSTLHWVLVLYKLWGSTCCPGCMADAAYEGLSAATYIYAQHEEKKESK